MSATTLTIHHDYESGTTVEGTEKNSPAHHAIKTNRSWTWSRYARAWLLRSSRHCRPKYRDIDIMERTLIKLGYTVTRDIDETMPTVEQQEVDLAERMDARADRLAERADKHAGASAASEAKADAVFDNIPFGQPILVGHHSETADSNRRERARTTLSRSVEQTGHAAELSRRSNTAAAHMGARNDPVTVGNRIAQLEAERRGVQRRLDGEDSEGVEFSTDEHGDLCGRSVTRPQQEEARARLTADADAVDEQIHYWNRVYAELQVAGTASTAGPDTVAKGDWVLIRGHWYRVRRVNKKTVSVPSHLVNAPDPGQRERTNTAPWQEVREHRTTEQMPAAFVDAYETSGTDRLRLMPAQLPGDAHDG